MTAVSLVRAIMQIIFFATTTIAVIFANFLLRRADTTVAGVMLPARQIHAVLGPVLVLLNALLFVYVCALYKIHTSNVEVAELQSLQKYKVFGAAFNPFYASGGIFANAVGYAFLIILWWFGAYSFVYSIGLNKPPDTPFLFGWQTLISILYFALGIASMIAIQACWQKFGFASYQLKLWVSFVGIAIGALLPPILLRQGLPFK